MLITRSCAASALLLGGVIAAAAVAKPPVEPSVAQVVEAPALETLRVLAAEEGRYRDRLARLERLREVAAGDAELAADVDAVHRRAIRIRAGRLGALREKHGDAAFFAALVRFQEARLRTAQRRGAGRDDGAGDGDGAASKRGGDETRARLGPRAYPDSKWILLCHCPPGDPSNHRTIRVSQKALAAHLGHGDQLGPCAGDGLEDAEFVDDPPEVDAGRSRGDRP